MREWSDEWYKDQKVRTYGRWREILTIGAENDPRESVRMGTITARIRVALRGRSVDADVR